MKLTEKKYRCGNCGKVEYLVITRNRAYLCKKCYQEMLAKRRAIKELNQIAREIIRG